MADEVGQPAAVEPEPARRLIRNPWIRRLPLLIVGGVGIWLWKGGEVQKREIIWQLPLEVRPQIVGFGGALMAREDEDATWEILKHETIQYAPNAAPSQVVWEVPLAQGEYRLMGGYSLPDGKGCRVDRTLLIDAEQVVVSVESPGAAACVASPL